MNVCPLLFTIDQEKSVLNSFLSVQLLVSVIYAWTIKIHFLFMKCLNSYDYIGLS